jgi:hypothetical protein
MFRRLWVLKYGEGYYAHSRQQTLPGDEAALWFILILWMLKTLL